MDFVTFDIAKKLKEKGFKLACIGHYEGDRFEYNTYDGHDINISYIARSYNDDDRFEKYADVPVICQVLKWLREEKGLHIEVRVDSRGFGACISHYDINTLELISFNPLLYHGFSKTYEEAAIAGIEYVIDNSI